MRFYGANAKDEAECTVGADVTAPGAIGIRWISPGEGRDGLNAMLGELLVLEVDHLATAAADGQTYRIAPLTELAQRHGWSLESKVEGERDSYRLQWDGDSKASNGPRVDLLLILELYLRCALQLVDGQAQAPSWMARAQEAHSKLVAALGGHNLLEAKQ